MKMITAILMAAMMLLSGCAMFGKGGLSPDKPGFEEGRVAAFLYVGTEKAQPAEVNAAIRAGYGVIKGIIMTGEDPARAIVAAEVEAQFPDATPEFRDMIVRFYDMGRARLDGVISHNIDIPVPTLVSNFIEGVESGLKDWKPGYAEGSAQIIQQAELDALNVFPSTDSAIGYALAMED